MDFCLTTRDDVEQAMNSLHDHNFDAAMQQVAGGFSCLFRG